jgi:hypothetical protein
MIALGLAAASLASLWWGLAYAPVIGTGLMSAGAATGCLAAASYGCQFALSICGSAHPFGLRLYSPALFLLGIGLTAGGVGLFGLRLALAPRAGSRGKIPQPRAFNGPPAQRSPKCRSPN